MMIINKHSVWYHSELFTCLSLASIAQQSLSFTSILCHLHHALPRASQALTRNKQRHIILSPPFFQTRLQLHLTRSYTACLSSLRMPAASTTLIDGLPWAPSKQQQVMDWLDTPPRPPFGTHKGTQPMSSPAYIPATPHITVEITPSQRHALSTNKRWPHGVVQGGMLSPKNNNCILLQSSWYFVDIASELDLVPK
jgi:hypothetical protein